MADIIRECFVCGHLLNISIRKDGSYSNELFYTLYDDGEIKAEYWECAECCLSVVNSI